jgi:hypothetical protein
MEELFTIAQVENAFRSLRVLLDAQGGDGSSDGRFLLDDVEADILRLLQFGLTEDQKREIEGKE